MQIFHNFSLVPYCGGVYSVPTTCVRDIQNIRHNVSLNAFNQHVDLRWIVIFE